MRTGGSSPVKCSRNQIQTPTRCLLSALCSNKFPKCQRKRQHSVLLDMLPVTEHKERDSDKQTEKDATQRDTQRDKQRETSRQMSEILLVTAARWMQHTVHGHPENHSTICEAHLPSFCSSIDVYFIYIYEIHNNQAFRHVHSRIGGSSSLYNAVSLEMQNVLM